MNVDRFIVRAQHEWAFIYTDEQTGLFVAYSSFGTFAHCWAHRGPETLKQFVADLDYGYFMGKTRGRDMERFDFDKTIKGMKEYIADARRQGSLIKEEARDAWDDVETIENTQSVDLFVEAVYRSYPIGVAYNNDFGDVIENSPDPQCVGFWKIIWPEFLKRLALPTAVAAAA